MASTYTPLGVELQATGENAGTWGTKTNTNLQIFEQIAGGFTQQSIAGGAQTTTLSVSDGSTGAVLSHRMIEFTGTITGNQVVTIPLDVQTFYYLRNSTSGAYTVQFKYVTGSGDSLTFSATDKGDQVVFDYTATVNDKPFKGGEGKNTQLTLGKDLFLKGFDKQLIGVKKGGEKMVEATLPENFPEKDLVNKKAKFSCKIIAVKNPEEVKINDEFAKNLGAKDLNDLKTLISKQINDEYKNSLDQLSKTQILKEIEKIKVDEIPENLIEEEVKILSQGMDEVEAKKNKPKFTETAKTRIKTGLILNEFGEQNKIQVSEQEIQAEVQKQLRMMPGQEKMVMDFYQKNPSAVASLRGTVYEEKILNLIKEKAKPNKKEITKDEAEKILKDAHKHDHDHDTKEDKKVNTKPAKEKKSPSKASKSKSVAKKVSKK